MIYKRIARISIGIKDIRLVSVRWNLLASFGNLYFGGSILSKRLLAQLWKIYLDFKA